MSFFKREPSTLKPGLTTRLPLQRCPHCNTSLSAATSVHGLQVSPKKGDYTVCVECAKPLVFDLDADTTTLIHRKLTAAEEAKLPEEVYEVVRFFKQALKNLN